MVQAESKGTIKFGWTAWSDNEAIHNLAKVVLEDKMGYDVELTMADIGIQFQAVARGDIDAMLGAWLPLTHKNYLKKYCMDVVNIGPIYTHARNGWVVPDYIPKDKLNSVEDLTDPEVAEELDHKITGIDPGSGIMQASEVAMKEYGLDDAGYRLISSSGAGMTSALARAIRRNEWIVVTGWSPHWKFNKWDLRYLKEPKGVLGGLERCNGLVRRGFYNDYPEVFDFLNRFSFPLEHLQGIMYDAEQTSYREAAKKYVKEHPERVNYWVTGDLK
jgi:glycine betaine/proline transport system substrate-binding protein